MERSAELCELISGYFDSFTAGDPQWVDSYVLNGAELRLIGTSAEEWLEGTEGFSTFQREAAGATGALTAEVFDVEAYSHGDVGWGAAESRQRAQLDSGRRRGRIRPRLTASRHRPAVS